MRMNLSLLLILTVIASGCGEETADDVVREARLTWSGSERVFEIDGVRAGNGDALEQYLHHNSSSFDRIVVEFPDGEPVLAVDYVPAYARTRFAKICHDNQIEVVYRTAKGAHINCYQITLVRGDTPGEKRIDYMLNGEYIGRGDDGLKRIREMRFKRKSFVQIVPPWNEGQDGPMLFLSGLTELWQDLIRRGIRVEYRMVQ